MIKGAGNIVCMEWPPAADGRCHYGDIYALADDRAELEGLGIVLGRFNAALRCFEGCHIPPAALQGLQALGGKYLWTLSGEPGVPYAVH
jgi:hypothetical protein